MNKLLAIAAALVALTGAADAQMSKRNGASKPNLGITFERWANYCQEANTKAGNAKSTSPKSIGDSQFCYGLTLGVVEGIDFVVHDEKLNTICVPDGTPTREMVEVGQAFFRRVVKDDASLKDANFAMGLAYAFLAVWPCGSPS